MLKIISKVKDTGKIHMIGRPMAGNLKSSLDSICEFYNQQENGKHLKWQVITIPD